MVLGSGGREHAFCWKLAQSKMIDQLFVAPGNAGTDALATNLNIDVTDFIVLKNAVIQNNIDLVVLIGRYP